MKKTHTILMLLLSGFSVFSQNVTDTIKFTKNVDGVEVTENIEIDSTIDRMLRDIMKGKRPEFIKKNNDSVYNKEGRLDSVILAYSIYGATIKKFIYNNKGQVIKVIGYDKKGRIAPYFEYLAIREIDYDNMGRVIEERAYDENMKYVGQCAIPPIMQIRYDDKGNKKEVIYLNQKRELHERFTRTEFLYDENNNMIEKVNYNGKGEIIDREPVVNSNN